MSLFFSTYCLSYTYMPVYNPYCHLSYLDKVIGKALGIAFANIWEHLVRQPLFLPGALPLLYKELGILLLSILKLPCYSIS